LIAAVESGKCLILDRERFKQPAEMTHQSIRQSNGYWRNRSFTRLCSIGHSPDAVGQRNRRHPEQATVQQLSDAVSSPLPSDQFVPGIRFSNCPNESANAQSPGAVGNSGQFREIWPNGQSFGTRSDCRNSPKRYSRCNRYRYYNRQSRHGCASRCHMRCQGLMSYRCFPGTRTCPGE